MQKFKIVDLFAGPGGLGEGFSSLRVNGEQAFKIVVSAEKDKYARETLRLRSFWRLLKSHGEPLDSLYAYYRSPDRTPWTQETRDLWEQAGEEALCLELGKEEDNSFLYKRICQSIPGEEHWVLIGGPPCQAYSIVGRVRSGTKSNKKDPRHYLYQQYLNVIQQFHPSIFVMENVRGILSCRLDQGHIIDQILADLASPDAASNSEGKKYNYTIHSLVADTSYEPGMDASSLNLHNFVVQCEQYGIPQARHRVILVGIREDISRSLPKLIPSNTVSVWDAIGDMPRVRSGLSRVEDSAEAWMNIVESEMDDLARLARDRNRHMLAKLLWSARKEVLRVPLERGGRWLAGKSGCCGSGSQLLCDWLLDDEMGGWVNHETRAHMPSDLRRYAYAAAYGRVEKNNPVGAAGFDLPGLAPNHTNWKSGDFADRFKVQLADRPSATITSHLSKDGHYFIHPDPSQCRSLTVREAARLQTFPDNYFFEGPRTEQYTQVGNAVPPLLAKQIAECVWAVLQGDVPS
jgi:DNA (cytosine-5)-methyltransferase 1